MPSIRRSRKGNKEQRFFRNRNWLLSTYVRSCFKRALTTNWRVKSTVHSEFSWGLMIKFTSLIFQRIWLSPLLSMLTIFLNTIEDEFFPIWVDWHKTIHDHCSSATWGALERQPSCSAGRLHRSSAARWAHKRSRSRMLRSSSSQTMSFVRAPL